MDGHRHGIPKDSDSDLNEGYALSGKVMLTSVITLFSVVLIIVCFHMYARCFILRHRRRLFHRVSAISRLSLSSPGASRGLDAAVLANLPTFVYANNPSEPPLDCAVCLSEFEEGESGRILPKCSHTFHVDCIDTWFMSRSCCPLCRAPVQTAPVRIDQTVVPVPVSGGDNEPDSSESETLNLPPPVECRRKSPELVGVVVEMAGRMGNPSRSGYGGTGSNSLANEGLSLSVN